MRRERQPDEPTADARDGGGVAEPGAVAWRASHDRPGDREHRRRAR